MRSLLVLCLLLPCWLSARELIIGGILEPPLKWLDHSGQPRGLDVDLVTTIFGGLKVPIRIELLDSGARLTRNAEGGVYDLLLSHSYKPERESYLLYPKQAHIRHSWHFFVRKADMSKIHYQTLADLKPWHPAVSRVKQQMQAGGGAHQERHRAEQQHDKNQNAEADLLP